MNNPEATLNFPLEQDVLERVDDEAEWEDDSCFEHEKEAYIKHIRQNLGQ